MNRSQFESSVSKTIAGIINKGYLFKIRHQISKEWSAKNLDISNLHATDHMDDITVDYIIDNNHKESTTISIEVHIYRDICKVKIGHRGSQFRLKMTTTTNSTGSRHHELVKDLTKDAAFQKSLFKKLLPKFEYSVPSTIQLAEKSKREIKIVKDVQLQFPDFDVLKGYRGWTITHNTTNIKIQMTAELDIEQISIPTGKFVCYPDDEFMTKLLSLFEERVDSSNDN